MQPLSLSAKKDGPPCPPVHWLKLSDRLLGRSTLISGPWMNWRRKSPRFFHEQRLPAVNENQQDHPDRCERGSVLFPNLESDSCFGFLLLEVDDFEG